MFSWRSPSSDRKVLGKEAAFPSGQQVGLDRNSARISGFEFRSDHWLDLFIDQPYFNPPSCL